MKLDVDSLAVRVTKLERENYWLKVFMLTGMIASAAVVSFGFTDKPRTIEAERIIVRDNRGRPRIIFGTPEVVGAAVDMKADTPGIWLTDDNGVDRAILSIDGLYFANSRSRPLAELTTEGLRIHSPDGKVVGSAP